MTGPSPRGDLLAFMATPVGAGGQDAAFDALALSVFAWQFEHNATYAAYCRRRGGTPATVRHWSAIPAVPTHAFKALPLVSGEAGATDQPPVSGGAGGTDRSPASGGAGGPDPSPHGGALFRTSGTTRGPERRGEHHVPDLALYHASLLPTFDAFVLPDGARPPMLSLVPAAQEAPDSSLSYMVTRVMAERGGGGGGTFVDAAGQLDAAALDGALRAHQEAGTPVCLLGTSLAFLHWLEHLEAAGVTFALPAGSRLMDTGGYKGTERTVSGAELRAAYLRLLGVPAHHCVNEYGMTELLSQYYDDALRRVTLQGADASTDEPRTKAGPPWLRSVAADPDTLEALPPGQAGILRHVDLANLRSVAAVQTEDLGRVLPDGRLELHGRLPGAEPRGCSLAMDELMRGAGNG